MSYQERRALVSLVATIGIAVYYSSVMAGRYPETGPYSEEIFRFWGTFFVILIPVTIVVKIVITIVFSILNTIASREGEPDVIDERDRLVELRANTYSLYVFSIGLVTAMALLALGNPPAVMFIALFCAGIASEIVSDVAQFYFYRRGF